MRLASLFLSICMAMTLQPFIALAEETGSGDISGYISGGIFQDTTWGNVTLTGDVSLSNGVTIQLDGTVTVRGAATLSGGTLIRQSGNSSILFSVEDGGKLTLENVVLDGGGVSGDDGWNGPSGNSILVVKSGGELTLDNGTTVQNHYAPSGLTLGGFDSGAAVHVYSGGALTMNAGSMIRNGRNESSDRGAGVSNWGSFTMNDGTVSGFVIANSYTSVGPIGGGKTVMGGSGGGIFNAGVFSMRGGEISGNSAVQYGGGVANYAVGNAPVFELFDGAEIKNNVVTGTTDTSLAYVGGGGVYTNRGAAFTMHGGRITENSASATDPNGYAVYGGGGLFLEGGTFVMESGVISNNETAEYGGGIQVYQGTANARLKGGNITGNRAAKSGGGIYQYYGTLTIEPTADGELHISENSAAKGGGLAVDAGNTAMTGGIVSENSATSNGGGVYISEYISSASFLGGEIVDNLSTNGSLGPDMLVGKATSIGRRLYVPNGMCLADGAYLIITAAFNDDARVGVSVQTPPVSCGIENGVLVAQTDPESQEALTEEELAHFTYDGGTCVLKRKESDGKLYACLSAQQPNIAIDYEAEKLTGLPESGTYTINGAQSYNGQAGASSLDIDNDWFGTTLTIVQKGDGGVLDSQPQYLAIPPRPGTPTLTVTHVSRLNWQNGKLEISGVAEGLTVECSEDSGVNWKAIPSEGIANTNAGCYQVRIKASNENGNFCSDSGMGKVYAYPYSVVNTPLEITSSSVTLSGGAAKGTGEFSAALQYRVVGSETWKDIAIAANCTADHVFEAVKIIGLAPDTDYEVQVTAVDKTTTLEHTVHIFFRTSSAGIPPKGTIETDVSGSSERPAVVSVRQGDTVLASAAGTVKNGVPFTAEFTSLPDGVYSVVCVSKDFIETRSVTIDNGISSGKTSFMIPAGNTNTIVKRKGEDTPPIAVQGLPALITEADTAAAASGATVEYVLTVKKEDETDAGGAESLKILAKEKGKAEDLYYLDIALEKTLVDASKKVTVNSIAGADQILEIAFPIPHGLSDRKNIVVFRYHEESAAALDKFLSRQQLPTTEGFYVDTAMGYVFVYARSFSTYALACDKLSGGFPEGARCTLSYVSNGGTAYPDEQVACGTTVRLEKTPWREGYTFLGWYSDRELTRPVTELVMNGSRTVYAKWKVTEIPAALNGTDHNAYLVGFEDGTVRPDAPVTRAEVAMIFYRLLKEDVRIQFETEQNPFADVNAPSWYNTAVSTLAGMGILNGRTSTSFAPGQPITRGEFAAVAARFSGESYSGGDLFPDIKTYWARESINLAASLGWVGGLQDGTFAPESSITRAEAVTLVNRMLLRLPAGKESLLPEMRTWPDNADENQWYYLAMQEASNSHNYQLDGDGVHETWTSLQ